MKPYFDDGQCVIYHGDCREVMPTLPAVDLVLTDPPYGIEKVHRTYQRASGPRASWDGAFDTEWLPLVAELTPLLALLPGIVNLLQCPQEIGTLRYRWTIALHIVNGMTRSPIGYGNWIPCVLYASDAVKLYRQASDITRVSVSGVKPDHPCPKPLSAMRYLVERLPGTAILDPFMGSGTTLLAAQLEGRSATGIEIDERYCEMAARRLQQQVLPFEVTA